MLFIRHFWMCRRSQLVCRPSWRMETARWPTPVHLIALLALFAFAVIGILLVIAMFVESRTNLGPGAPSSHEIAESERKHVA